MYAKHSSDQQCAKFSVAVLCCIFLFEWSVYLFVCMPAPGPAICFNLFFFLGLWSYLRVALTDPGTKNSPQWQEWEAERQSGNIAALGSEPSNEEATDIRYRGWKPGELSKCLICDHMRPERTHHCKHCNVCVLRMDHHCPWVGNCIGFRNHKYFILTAWWNFLACCVLLLTMNKPNAFEATTIAISISIPHTSSSCVPLIAVVLTLTLMIVTGAMVATTFCMAMTNTTSVEQEYRGNNPYRHNSRLDNLRQIFGPLDLWILMPVEAENKHNGTVFETPAIMGTTPGGNVSDGTKGYGTV